VLGFALWMATRKPLYHHHHPRPRRLHFTVRLQIWVLGAGWLLTDQQAIAMCTQWGLHCDICSGCSEHLAPAGKGPIPNT
jgi:hypothetical protein